jgi:hypothetical protein
MDRQERPIDATARRAGITHDETEAEDIRHRSELLEDRCVL